MEKSEWVNLDETVSSLGHHDRNLHWTDGKGLSMETSEWADLDVRVSQMKKENWDAKVSRPESEKNSLAKALFPVIHRYKMDVKVSQLKGHLRMDSKVLHPFHRVRRREGHVEQEDLG
jgi:hypothetical protein